MPTFVGLTVVSPFLQPAERLAVDVQVLAAVEVLRRARARLAQLPAIAAATEVPWQLVEEAADHLAETAGDPSCREPLAAVLLDWRDRLGSFVLAARALADLDVHNDLAHQLLCRGLDEAIDESPRRLTELRARLAAPVTSPVHK